MTKKTIPTIIVDEDEDYPQTAPDSSSNSNDDELRLQDSEEDDHDEAVEEGTSTRGNDQYFNHAVIAETPATHLVNVHSLGSTHQITALSQPDERSRSSRNARRIVHPIHRSSSSLSSSSSSSSLRSMLFDSLDGHHAFSLPSSKMSTVEIINAALIIVDHCPPPLSGNHHENDTNSRALREVQTERLLRSQYYDQYFNNRPGK